MRAVPLARLLAIAVAGAGLAAAASPSILDMAEPGLWEVSRPGIAPTRMCVAEPGQLAQFEHRQSSCTRDLVDVKGLKARIHYSCAAGDFGSSSLTLITPRSLRVETQGISGGAPFKYVFQARRVGNC